MIQIMPPNKRWPDEFLQLKTRLKAILGASALAIEHIGSTAVPGLAAKDVIDIQVSVAELGKFPTGLLVAKGWKVRTDLWDVYEGIEPTSSELDKLYAREPEGLRRTHVHIRERGRFNHRFALLFRDFLRANMTACQQYEALKQEAAKAYPNNIDGYLALKTPVFNLLNAMAETWATSSGWVEP